MENKLVGYKTLSVTQLANIFAVLVRGLGDFEAFRLLCAYLAFEAKHEATSRSLKKMGQPVMTWKGPGRAELREMIGGRTSIAKLWQSLEDVGLISRTGNLVRITETPLPEARPYLELLCGVDDYGDLRRSITRATPIPREWLGLWAMPARNKIMPLLHLFYCGVCLSFKNRRSSDVKNAATFKFEQLVRLTGLNRSRLTDARRRLISEKRISPDTTRFQRKLNRDGHYAAVNLDWKRSRKPTAAEIGRPRVRNGSETGRPYRDKKQALLVGRDQKPSGLLTDRTDVAPSPNNVRVADLSGIDRLRRLFEKQTWLSKTKANFLFFVSAAVKAREAGDSPAKLFVWLVRSRKVNFVSQLHEDAALRMIADWEQKTGETTCRDEQPKMAEQPARQRPVEDVAVCQKDRAAIRDLISKSLGSVVDVAA